MAWDIFELIFDVATFKHMPRWLKWTTMIGIAWTVLAIIWHLVG